jgi:hypothetical protein
MKIVMNVPSYETVLPISGTKVKFRPFVVKEEKVLLLALEEGQTASILNVIFELISACTDGTVNPDKLCQVDVEWLFLKIRNKSMGEGLEVTHECGCGKVNNLMLNLENVVVDHGTAIDPLIQLDSQLWVKMKQPKITLSNSLNVESEDLVFDVISACMEQIISGEDVFDVAEQSKEDVKYFLENLTQIQIDKIDVFFTCLPKLVYKVTSSCPACGASNEVKLEGLENFFV